MRIILNRLDRIVRTAYSMPCSNQNEPSLRDSSSAQSRLPWGYFTRSLATVNPKNSYLPAITGASERKLNWN
jgi:hypothetical protein